MKERVAQGRQVRGEGALAQEAHENRFYLLSESAANSYWLKDSQGDRINVRVGQENCQSKETGDCL